jgi:8-oxo-dGTP pyrophosphatase MutT (NUDIX family)
LTDPAAANASLANASLANDERIARLTGEARDRSWPNVRPLDAATLIVIDRAGPAPRVLMGKRHAGHKFMPNKFVFPGGRCEKADAAIPVGSELLPDVEAALIARVTRGTAARARRLALAAIRETFEETGLVIGRGGDARPRPAAAGPNPSGPWEEFLATGFLPDLGAIRYLARAITPPRRPKRFDTRFFVVEASAIQHKVEGIVGPESELTELAWLTLEETAGHPLPAITRVILTELETIMRAGGPGPGHAVPFYFERQRQFQRELIT